jgi:hypothetical protein
LDGWCSLKIGDLVAERFDAVGWVSAPQRAAAPRTGPLSASPPRSWRSPFGPFENGKLQHLKIAWSAPPRLRQRDIILPKGTDAAIPMPLRSESRARPVEAIAKARYWIDELISGEIKGIKESRSNST